jgi:hypothetical protein
MQQDTGVGIPRETQHGANAQAEHAPPLGIITAAQAGDVNAGGIAEMRQNHPLK